MVTTPETLTATARSQQLQKPDREKERLDKLRAGLALPSSTNRATAITTGVEIDGSVGTMSPLDIDGYDRNPRTEINPLYAEIKESIRQRGFEGALAITKRPGSDRYMLLHGGNTRLAILRELLASNPADPRWQRVPYVYKAWRGETAALAAHLVENEQRSPISFWDKAMAVAKLRADLEAAAQRPLSASEINTELAKEGIAFGVRTLRSLAFATEHLEGVGPWLEYSFTQKVLQPAFQRLQDLAKAFLKESQAKSAFLSASTQLATILKARAEESTEKVTLDPHELIAGAYDLFASELGVSTSDLERMLQHRDAHPRATEAELRAAAKAVAPTSSSKSPSMYLSPEGAAMGRPLATESPDVPSGTQGLQTQAPVQQPSQPKQLPLGPAMLASVAQATQVETRPQEERHEPPAPAPAASGAQSSSDLIPIEGLAPSQYLAAVQSYVSHVALAADLLDVLRLTAPALPGVPLGYYMDLPEVGFEHVREPNGMRETRDIELRRAAWQMLVCISGQLNPKVIASLAPLSEVSPWVQAATNGELRDRLAECGLWLTSADVGVSLTEQTVFWSACAETPELSAAFTGLLKLQQRFFEHAPERFDHLRSIQLVRA